GATWSCQRTNGPPLSETSTSKNRTPVPVSTALHGTFTFVLELVGGSTPRVATGGVVSITAPVRRKFWRNVGHAAAPSPVFVVQANTCPCSPAESFIPLTSMIHVLPPTEAMVGAATSGLVPEMVSPRHVRFPLWSKTLSHCSPPTTMSCTPSLSTSAIEADAWLAIGHPLTLLLAMQREKIRLPLGRWA